MQSVHLPLSVRTEEEFRWAVGIVKSRSVVLDGQVNTEPFCSSCNILHDILETETFCYDFIVATN